MKLWVKILYNTITSIPIVDGLNIATDVLPTAIWEKDETTNF